MDFLSVWSFRWPSNWLPSRISLFFGLLPHSSMSDNHEDSIQMYTTNISAFRNTSAPVSDQNEHVLLFDTRDLVKIAFEYGYTLSFSIEEHILRTLNDVYFNILWSNHNYRRFGRMRECDVDDEDIITLLDIAKINFLDHVIFHSSGRNVGVLSFYNGIIYGADARRQLTKKIRSLARSAVECELRSSQEISERVSDAVEIAAINF